MGCADSRSAAIPTTYLTSAEADEVLVRQFGSQRPAPGTRVVALQEKRDIANTLTDSSGAFYLGPLKPGSIGSESEMVSRPRSCATLYGSEATIFCSENFVSIPPLRECIMNAEGALGGRGSHDCALSSLEVVLATGIVAHSVVACASAVWSVDSAASSGARRACCHPR